MTQQQGDLAAPGNSFGMMVDYATSMIDRHQVARFYTFQITNAPGIRGFSQFSFYSYDGSKQRPWTNEWSTPVTGAFHAGLRTVNTVRVRATMQAMIFMVNGQIVGSVPVARLSLKLTSGRLGMLVGLKGAEVAFSHLLVTRP